MQKSNEIEAKERKLGAIVEDGDSRVGSVVGRRREWQGREEEGVTGRREKEEEVNLKPVRREGAGE